jgi:hypothetical protein
MADIGSLNLIHFLDFYFALMFFAGLFRRFGQYQSVARLIVSGPTRWPHLLKLISQYRTIFWTWGTLLPAVLALILWVAQMIASRSLFPDAGQPPTGLTLARLVEHWPALIVVVPLGVAMFGFDLYTLYWVGQFDRAELEKQLDEAEYWLRSKTASVLRVVTFGFLNPRRMVADEVEKALRAVSDMLNFTLWWVSLQTGLRLGFALALWITWAVSS